jgi:phage repressor protein C with HTH and peptisase S24 domain
MTDREKLTALMEKFSGGSQQRFAELIGVPRSNIATWLHRDRITANGREAILDTFPSVSPEWLMEGTERRPEPHYPTRHAAEMLLSSPKTIHFARTELIPLFDECRASCGIVEQFEHPEIVADHIRLPGVEAVAALHAQGISMEPSIHDGDLCLVGDEVRLNEVNQRHIYLIVTTDGHCMFKRICDEGKDSPVILVISENPEYVPHVQSVPKESLLRLFPLTYVIHRFV